MSSNISSSSPANPISWNSRRVSNAAEASRSGGSTEGVGADSDFFSSPDDEGGAGGFVSGSAGSELIGAVTSIRNGAAGLVVIL